MKCEEMVNYLSEYLDNEMEADLIEEMRRHLAHCDNCQVVLSSTKKTIELYHRAGGRGIPSERRGEIFSRLKEALETCKHNPPDLPPEAS